MRLTCGCCFSQATTSAACAVCMAGQTVSPDEAYNARKGLRSAAARLSSAGIAPELVGAARARRHGPHDEMAMTGEILGDRHHRKIRPERQRAIKAGAAPGVVDGQKGVTTFQQPR